ncbi:MAG TPA: sigma-E factor negative regulatory protein [Steroidobacteraceae bacterium]|nr:sigma-E factor negative regulatory protein [Steroidobacteraceae bacterium]
MSEQIREQVSAFLDGELPSSETELLLKRLTRDAELRESFGRYALIGESFRGSSRVPLTRGFADRVNRAIDGERAAVTLAAVHGSRSRWWRPIAGASVAAGVAAVAVFALQQRADQPAMRAALPATARNLTAVPKEAISYTVPAAVPDAPAVLPAARLTNYVFAHSQYSSVLGQRNVLSGLLADADEQQVNGNGRAVAGAAVSGTPVPAPPADPRADP